MKTCRCIYGLLAIFIATASTNITAQTQPLETPPGVVVAHLEKETGKYIGSPSICILPNGDYVASHDEFGPKSGEFQSARTQVFASSDKGKSWKKIASIDGQFWSNLFVHRGVLYLMGTNKHHGNFILRRSMDGGHTWTVPYSPQTGLLLEGEYHTAPMPVIVHKGRVWRALEYATAPTTAWGKRYSAMMISAPERSDLLDARNWTRSNALPYDSTYLGGRFNAWLEGNAVVDPAGKIVDMLRVDVPAGTEERAAIVRISPDGKRATFDPANDFIPFPGGSKKFTIRFDPVSKCYWSLVNALMPEDKDKAPAGIRNRLVLVSSPDLRSWTEHQTLLYHPDRQKHGFQYVDWQFEGDDIIFLSRTAFDDSAGGAHNNHDANFLTFHRIEGFRLSAEK